MAENFGKVIQRTMTRTKEKVLRNLGNKGSFTIDDNFEVHRRNFATQQNAALKLQKELKHYNACLRDIACATNNIYKTCKELYEPTWVGYTDFCVSFQELPISLDKLLLSVIENAITPINQYVAQFPDIKTKIGKRNRKLTDLDACKHQYESIMAKKTRDPSHLQKTTEEMEKAQKKYDAINSEVSEDMSKLYNNRVYTLSSVFSALINSDLQYYQDAGKCRSKMLQPLEILQKDSERYMDKSVPSPSPMADDCHFVAPPKPLNPPAKYNKVDEEMRFIQSEYSLTEIAKETTDKRKSGVEKKALNGKLDHNKSSSAGDHDDEDDGDVEEHGACSGGHDDDDEDDDVTAVACGGDSGSKDDNIKLKSTELSPPGKNSLADKIGENLANLTNDGDNNNDNNNSQYEICSPVNVKNNNMENVKATNDRKILSHKIDINKNTDNDTPLVTNSVKDLKSSDDGIITSKKENQMTLTSATTTTTTSLTSTTTATATLPITTVPTIKTSVADVDVNIDNDAKVIKNTKISTFVPPERILFKVEATHKYIGEDTDELSFDVGDIIIVVPFDNPEDQDDGWLMGIIEKSKEKGVFPQNFTKKID